MSDVPPENKPPAIYSVISLTISGLASLIGASVILGGRGAGMEALASLVPLIVFGGGGLVVAFFFAIVAISRSEQPETLSTVAVCIPPAAVFFALLLGR